jgi:hypothetical protein
MRKLKARKNKKGEIKNLGGGWFVLQCLCLYPPEVANSTFVPVNKRVELFAERRNKKRKGVRKSSGPLP